jgi:hypothetical protein
MMNRLLKFQVLLCGLWVTAGGMSVVAQPLQEPEPPEPAVLVRPENRQIHKAGGLIFETPAGFSEVQTLKNDTVGVVSDNQRITVRMMPLAPDTLSFLNMEDAELMNYVKYFFLGINAPSTNYPQRHFLDRPVTGELQIQRHQAGFTTTEIYLVSLSAGYKVAIAFEADDQLPIMQVEETINTVAQSLQEDPEILAERLKKLKKRK